MNLPQIRKPSVPQRDTIAAAAMAAGIAAVSAGVALQFGIGLGVLALGVCLVGLALLLGWV